MTLRFWVSLILSSMMLAIPWSWFSPKVFILDETSYHFIAQKMSWSRPYDWQMPWPPYSDNAFIFAHPPLFLWWVKAVGDAWWTGWIPQTLLIFSTLGLTFRSTKHPYKVFLLWICCASVFLPGTRTLMPDLWMSALGMTAMWCFWESQLQEKWFVTVLGILSLALASWVKYPAGLLLLIPLLHGRNSQKLWWGCGYFLLLAMFEGWLFLEYGRWHLYEVLRTASEIGHSNIQSRFFGIFARIAISALPLTLLLLTSVQQFWKIPLGLAILSFIWNFQEGVDAVIFAIFVFVGALILRLFQTVEGSFNSQRDWPKMDWPKMDWKVTWAVVILLGVCLGHNYTSPRYWMVAMWPLASLMERHCAQMFQSTKMRTCLALSIIGLCFLGYTERMHAQQSSDLITLAQQKYPTAEFSGEWALRHQAESLGMVYSRDPSQSPLLLSAQNSAGAMPLDSHEIIDAFETSSSWIPLVSAEQSVGYYADTLGLLPIGISFQPIERVDVWKKR